MQDAFRKLFRSEAFWMAVLDAAVLSALLLLVEFLPSTTFELVQKIVWMWQPVALLVIGALTVKAMAQARALASLGEMAYYVSGDEKLTDVSRVVDELAGRIERL